MNKSFKVVMLFLIIILTLQLVACGQDKTTELKASTKTGNLKAETKKVKLTVIGEKRPDQPEFWNKIIQTRIKFFKQKYPNIQIETVKFGSVTDYRQEYDKQLMSGTAPDVIDYLPYVDIPSRIENGTVADITEFVDSWELKKKNQVLTYFDEAISTNDGKWYAVPSEAYYSGLTYNVNTIKAGGGDPNNLPKTWEELTAIGQKISDPAKQRYGLALLGMEWNAWEFTAWVWSAGGEMVKKKEDKYWRITFNEAPGIDAAMLWHDMVWKYKMTQKNILEDWNAFSDDIASGRVAFGWQDISTFLGQAQEKYQAKPEDFGIIPVPGKDASQQVTFVGGSVAFINPNTTEPDQKKAAWNYIMNECYDEDSFMAQAQIKADNNSLQPAPPNNMNLTEKYDALVKKWPEIWKKDYLVLREATVKAEPFCPHWNDLKNLLSKPLQQILLKENLNRNDCTKILNSAAESLYKKYPDTFRK